MTDIRCMYKCMYVCFGEQSLGVGLAPQVDERINVPQKKHYSRDVRFASVEAVRSVQI